MERQLAALHIETYGIHGTHNTCYGSGNGTIIIDVGMGRLKAEVSVGKQCSSAFWMPGCDPHRKISLNQVLDDAPAKKASPAEYGHLLARYHLDGLSASVSCPGDRSNRTGSIPARNPTHAIRCCGRVP
jgi:hypothetical protein